MPSLSKQFLTEADICWFPDWDTIVAHNSKEQFDYLIYTSVGYESFKEAAARANGFIAQIKRQAAPLVPFSLKVEPGKYDWSVEYRFRVLELERA